MFPQIIYVCQTYVEVERSHGKRLERAQQFDYKNANDAEKRAQRLFEGGGCVGADAFKVVYDPETDELSDPEFLLRLGKVPSVEE